MTDLRCDSKLHGQIEDQLIKIKCSSKFCGAGPGVVVIHCFDLQGNHTKTLRYKDAGRRRSSGTPHRTPVRTP